MVSLWYFISLSCASVTAILFIYNLTLALDTKNEPDISDKLKCKTFLIINIEPSFLNTFYIVFGNAILTCMVAYVTHKYFMIWINSIYGDIKDDESN